MAHNCIRLTIVLLLGASSLFAGDKTPRAIDFPPRLLKIEFIETSLKIDGRLDEPVWGQLRPSADFVQTEPDEGQPSSERTEVFVFYDHSNIYFGFKCYDSEPHRIIARLDARDTRTNSDSVQIFLDPFGDRRNGYQFSLNARGHQFDALVAESGGGGGRGGGRGGGSFDPTWDGIWEGAAQIEDWGWSAEIAIPFKTIRFAAGRTWGLNFSRNIVRKNERAYWQFVTRFDGRARPSKAGYLEGIQDIEPGRNIELVPYVSGRFRRGATNPLDNTSRAEGGADVRWGLLPFATLNLAINPDFADTEADEENISISRFELFFPEKRNFFNEGSNFFRTPMNLFFSRRVGARLPDGDPQRILLGAKLTGKVNGWSLGVLEARTQQERFIDPDTGTPQVARGANFFVLRAQRDIWENSSIGFLTVNRDQEAGDIASTQRAHAFDLNIVAGPHLRWSSQVVYNQNRTQPFGGIHRMGAETSVSYDARDWEWNANYKYLGRGFDVSKIGFEPESDRHSGYANIQWKPFLGHHGIRQFFFQLNQDISFDTSGLLQDSGSDADMRVQFTNFWSARVRYSYDRVRFEEFTPAFTRLPDTRIYIEPRLRFQLNSNDSRAVSFNYEFLWRKMAQFRENFYGRAQDHRLGVTARLFGRTRVQLDTTIIREALLDGTPFQMRRLFVGRVNHQITRKLRFRVLGQVSNNRNGQNFNVNSIMAYEFTARSAAIVGYNYQRRSPGALGDLGNEFFFKFSYLFQF